MRWFLLLVLVACGSPSDPVGVATPAPASDAGPDLNGLFGGSGGGTNALPTLQEDGSVVHAELDAGLDAALPDSSFTVEEDASLLEDAAVDAEVDAGPLHPQCRTCGEVDSEFLTCPEGFLCMENLGPGGLRYCTAKVDASGMCPEHLSPVVYFCKTLDYYCPEWLDAYGN